MKYIKQWLLLVALLCTAAISIYAESDVSVNDRLIAIQKQVCPFIQDTALQKKCQELSSSFLPDTTKQWKVERVVDGDTVILTQNKTSVKVRLMGVDTPETKSVKKGVQCYGPEAYEFTKKQLEGKKVFMQFDSISGSKDIYDRYLSYIYLSKKKASFNQSLIEQGFAREYSMDQPYQFRTEFKALQKKAEEAKLGLWGSCE